MAGTTFNRDSLAVLWAWHDVRGPGGPWRLVWVENCGRLREAPAVWVAFLDRGERFAGTVGFFKERPRHPVRNWQMCLPCGGHHFAVLDFGRSAATS